MVELGFGGGSNPTPPTQIHIPPDLTQPHIYPLSHSQSQPYPTFPYPTKPHPTPSHPTPSTNYLYLYPALLCPALGKTWNGLEWNSIMSSFKEHSLFMYNLPHTINPTDHLTPTPQTLTLIPLTFTLPQTLTPRL